LGTGVGIEFGRGSRARGLIAVRWLHGTGERYRSPMLEPGLTSLERKMCIIKV
jgi:hypothetical protein